METLLNTRPFADLTDGSLVNEDTNSILANDTDRTIPGNLEMQVRKSFFVRISFLMRKSKLGEAGE